MSTQKSDQHCVSLLSHADKTLNSWKNVRQPGPSDSTTIENVCIVEPLLGVQGQVCLTMIQVYPVLLKKHALLQGEDDLNVTPFPRQHSEGMPEAQRWVSAADCKHMVNVALNGYLAPPACDKTHTQQVCSIPGCSSNSIVSHMTLSMKQQCWSCDNYSCAAHDRMG